jgi:hypothetical protein
MPELYQEQAAWKLTRGKAEVSFWNSGTRARHSGMPVSRRAAMVALLAGALAAGCSNGKVEEPAAESPIAEALGLGYDPLRGSTSNPGALGEQILEEMRRQEEAIASCMQEAGFEYVPFVPESSGQLRLMDDELRFDTREWYAKYGFFLTTAAFPQSAVGSDLVGFDDSGLNDLNSGPNREIFDAMAPPEQEAYLHALYGDLPAVGGSSAGEGGEARARGDARAMFAPTPSSAPARCSSRSSPTSSPIWS